MKVAGIGSRRFLIALVLPVILGACATSEVLVSQKSASPAEPLKRIEIIYRENELRAPGLVASQKRPEALESLGYYRLSSLLVERAPRFFEANGVDVQVVIIPSHKPDGAPPVGKLAPQRVPRLELSVEDARLWRSRQTSGVNLSLYALLDDAPKDGKINHLWSGVFKLSLGDDPGLGVLKVTRVDAHFVDGVLKLILEKIAEEGMVALPKGKAVEPTS
ncbi:hypothetical protein [Niveibacterium terrae]|uniref:hypothetical protein n=1 Tax=Niveibacterium terrae TaxID=3373598 RepID=UPI003A9025EF